MGSLALVNGAVEFTAIDGLQTDHTPPSKHERLRIAKLNNQADPAAPLSLRERLACGPVALRRRSRNRSSAGCGEVVVEYRGGS